MAIRLAGMVSGMDTDSMVKDLVKAYSTKKDNIVKQKMTVSYKQEAWKSLNTKIYSFYNSTLDNMRFSSNYNKKKTTVSDTTKASVVSSDGAVKGSQSLAVKQMATSAYLTGGQLDKSTKGSTKLSELGIDKDSKIDVKIGDKTTSIDLKQDMTLDDVASALGKAGLTASFDAKNNRFFVSAKNSGTEGNFSFSATSGDGMNALSKLGLNAKTDSTSADYKTYEQWAGYVDGTSTDDEIWAKIVAGEGTSVDNLLASRQKGIEDQISALKSKNDEYNAAIKDSQDALTKIADDAGYQALNAIDETEWDTKLAAAQIDGTGKSKDEKIQAYLLKQETDLKTKLETESDPDAKANLETDLAKISSDLGTVNASIYHNTIVDTRTDAIAANDAEIADKETYLVREADGTTTASAKLSDEIKQELVDKAKFADGYIKGNYDSLYSEGAVKIEGKDAQISLNGADFSSSSNTFNINGLTITALEETGINEATGEYKTVNLTTEMDYDGIYDSVKNFFKEYNELITEIDKLYNAPAAKGYKPLTDDERKELSDKEAEAWDAKIKDSILRRDSSLDSVANMMKQSLSQSFTLSDGKDYSLSSFGVNTLSYFLAGENEKGVYHIDGNPDDSDVSGETDKLKAMLASDPEKVTEFFTKITTDLHSKMFDKMQSSEMNSVWKVYNDKKMQSDYESYEKKIAKWEEKIKNIEDKYYKQFAAMEKAMAKLQNSSSSLTGLLGG